MKPNRLYDAVNEMHKEANILSGVGKAIAKNPSAAIGAGLGATYGAYKGSEGEDGGLKGSLVGGLQGAFGGAVLGGVGSRMGKAVMGTGGKPGVFGQLRESSKAMKDKAGITDDMSFMQRFKKMREYKKGDEYQQAMSKFRDQSHNISEAADASIMPIPEARKQMDALVASNPFTQHMANRDKLIFGGLGGGYAMYEGSKALSAAANSGKGITDEQRLEGLKNEYRRTGKLDERQLNMLSDSIQGIRSKAQSSAV